MDNQNNEKRARVTECIKDRFAVLIATDTDGITETETENYAYICALALDMIGAGKIKSGECHDLMIKAINADFNTVDDFNAYVANIRTARKPREMSALTKAKNDAKILLRRNGYTTAQIAAFVGLDESIILEIANELNK